MRKKRWALVLALCIIAAMISGCAQEQTTYPEAGPAAQRPQQQEVRQQDVLQTATEAPAAVVEFPDGYEPGETEADAWDDDSTAEDTYTADTVTSRYAGSTPIPIDPVDMPTPTPKPDLKFEYMTYDTKLGYSFEAPIGWVIEADDATHFTLTDPTMRDNVNGQIMLTAQNVSASYKASELRGELSNQLTQLQRNYVGWKIWTADNRKLLQSEGVYNAYRGERYDGTAVRGIVHVALVNKKVVTLSFAAPADYNTSYQRVYNQVRNTIK